MHICRFCKLAVCNLFCSKQDANYSDNEMKRIHKKGKGCKMDNPLDKFKYKCPECSLMVKRIDVKNHLKENHGLGVSLISKSPVSKKCFDCKFHAPNLDAFNLHIKNHRKKDKQNFICK